MPDRLLHCRPVKLGRAIGERVQRGAITPSGRAERLGRATGSERLARAGQRVDVVGAVLSLVIVAVIAYVGIDVIAEVADSTGLETSADPGNRTFLENASANLDSGIEGAYGIMGVVFLVILLSVIIGLFVGLRQ